MFNHTEVRICNLGIKFLIAFYPTDVREEFYRQAFNPYRTNVENRVSS